MQLKLITHALQTFTITPQHIPCLARHISWYPERNFDTSCPRRTSTLGCGCGKVIGGRSNMMTLVGISKSHGPL